MPIQFEQCLLLVKETSLVNIFARLSAVDTFFTITVPLATSLHIKWYRMSICFIILWYIAFLVNLIALWLSQKMTDALSYFTPSFVNKCFNQRASFASFIAAIYSASMVDKTIVSCKIALQLTAKPLRIKHNKLKISFLSRSLAKPKSTKQTTEYVL